MIDYDYFYRERMPLDDPWTEDWDLLVSGFDDSERVRTVRSLVPAVKKDWLIHPEYGFDRSSYPQGPFVELVGSEDEAIIRYVDHLVSEGIDLGTTRMCVDITGMLRPHLMFLLKLLRVRGVRRFDVLYAEPQTYAGRENTRFNAGDILDTREVAGFSGINVPSGVEEMLIVAPGFDEASFDAVIGEKESASRIEIYGLPSLQADMYQLNVLKAYRPDAPVMDAHSPKRRFASASDPFAVASELSRTLAYLTRRGADRRFYLAPLATKAQALGFALFFVAECEGAPVSIIYPFTGSIAPRTGRGISGIWRYTVDFELLDALVERSDGRGSRARPASAAATTPEP